MSKQNVLPTTYTERGSAAEEHAVRVQTTSCLRGFVRSRSSHGAERLGTPVPEATWLAALSTAELSRHCHEETAHYRRHEPHDDRFCFELLRRAIADRDEDCWEALYTIYDEQVRVWCCRAGAARSGEPAELAVQAWTKFWHSYTPDKLAGSASMAAVLQYLKLCAYSVVIDANRAHQTTASLDAVMFERADPAPTPEAAALAQASRAALWQAVGHQLRNEQERTLVQLRFQLGLKPAEIQAARPEAFPRVQDVYRVSRNVLDRLARSAQLQALLRDIAAP